MAELADRENERREADQRFAAAIHGVKLEDGHGRTYGPRQRLLDRINAQRRGH